MNTDTCSQIPLTWLTVHKTACIAEGNGFYVNRALPECLKSHINRECFSAMQTSALREREMLLTSDRVREQSIMLCLHVFDHVLWFWILVHTIFSCNRFFN